MSSRQLISSGSKWEPVIGYSRAVRVGNHVFIAGTTASSPEGAVGETAAEQTREILTRLTAVLEEAGANLADVVRTRMYLTSIDDFDAVGAVHGEFFGEIRPAATAVEVRALVERDLLIEIEIDAVIIEA
ncbi:MAG: RidA family protein [Microbacteriaceae bacterium]